jgi:hypothetical protein
MKSSALTVKEYLASLPPERRDAISSVRDLVNRRLPKGYCEAMGYGMITWSVPLEVYPDTYNREPLMYAALASQKQYMAVYLMGISGDSPIARAFRDGFASAGKKLDKGKSCVRFKQLEDLHLPAIGNAIAACAMNEYIRRAQAAHSPAGRAARREGRAKSKPAAGRNPASKRAAKRPAAARSPGKKRKGDSK